MKLPWKAIVPPAAVMLGVIIVWEALVRLLHVKPYILPTPSMIVLRLLHDQALILDNLRVTLLEVLLGFFFAGISAFVAGVAIAHSRLARRSLYPLIVLFHTVPVIAIAPVLVIWFGYNIWPRVIVTALIAFFPMVVNVVAGFAAAEPEQIAFFRAQNASRWAIFRKLSAPAAMPLVFAGLKITAVLAVIGATVSEWIGADRGIGHLIALDTSQLETDRVFAAISVMSMVGIALFALIAVIEWLVLPWEYVQRRTPITRRLQILFATP